MSDELDVKVSSAAFDIFDLTERPQFNIWMPADLDQFGGDNSHGTIIGGKRFVQL